MGLTDLAGILRSHFAAKSGKSNLMLLVLADSSKGLLDKFLVPVDKTVEQHRALHIPFVAVAGLRNRWAEWDKLVCSSG